MKAFAHVSALRPMPGVTLPESGRPAEKRHGEESRVSIVAIAHRGGRRGPEDFASRLDAESAYAMEQFKPGSNRPGLLDRLEHAPALPSPYRGESREGGSYS